MMMALQVSVQENDGKKKLADGKSFFCHRNKKIIGLHMTLEQFHVRSSINKFGPSQNWGILGQITKVRNLDISDFDKT